MAMTDLQKSVLRTYQPNQEKKKMKISKTKIIN